MILRLLNKENQFLGRLEVTPDKVNLVEGNQEVLAPVVESINREGATYFSDISDNHTSTIIEKKAEPGSEIFPLAVKEHLERLGYEVTQEHPDVEKEIRSILNNFPDSNPDKKAILEKLPSLNYLEQTFLLEELKKEGF